MRGTGTGGFAKGKAFVIDRTQADPFRDVPEGSIVVAESITLADSARLDFKKVAGLIVENDPEGEAELVGRGTGVPAVSGITGCTESIVTGDRVLIQHLDVLVNPDLSAVNRFERERTASDTQLSLDL